MESQSERRTGGNRGRGDGGGGGQRRNYYPRRGGGGGGRGRGGGGSGGYSNNQGDDGYDGGSGSSGRGGRGGYTNQDIDNGGGGGGRLRGGRRGGYSNNQGGDDERGNWRRERGGGGGRGGDQWRGRDYNNSRGRGGSGNGGGGGGGRGFRNNNYPPFGGGGGGRRQEEEGRGEDINFSLNPDAPSFQPNNRHDNNDNSDNGFISHSSGPPPPLIPKEISTARVQQQLQQQRARPSKNQKETLTDHLNRNSLECMVCCEKVRYSQPIWSCRRCFNIFHLNCIRKWVDKSDDEGGWRCPSCQSLCPTSSTPLGYYCFCGKTKSPKPSRHEVPHTCSQICGRSRPTCQHPCPHPCHPGPCPTCENQETRFCGCGATSAIFLCTSQSVLACGGPCNKTLPCGLHKCTLPCHQDPCPDCPSKVTLSCYCGCSPKKSVPCTPSTSSSPPFYCCSKTCSKRLSCGTHNCPKICHPGSCAPCPTSPQVLLSCPCGQTSISKACALQKLPPRRRCTDPIPTCGRTCSKILPCGDDLTFHTCQVLCHLSPSCPPCSSVSNVKCRCGSKTKEIKCATLIALRSSSEEITCQKKCSKKRSCGKHKCLNTCCIDLDHVCPLPCQRALTCGLHKCDRLCHALQGPCPPCPLASFDELTCECGNAVIYPPVPCGTKRPPCPMPCSRTHECDHQVLHPCHSEPNCPPCTVLTEKWCHGTHELRKNVPCHISSLSCGLPCKKGLSCGRHSCPKTCHAGACLEPREICKLPCLKQRESCGHSCGAPCHEGDCPENKCKITTQVTCLCGRRADNMVCWKRENEYDRLITWEYHKELKRLEGEEETTLHGGGEEKKMDKVEIMAGLKLKFGKCGVLECDKECAKEERNRKLAEALQVEDGDPSSRGGSGGDSTGIGPPNYSEFLVGFCKKQPQFVETIHKQLTDLVMKAKQQSHKKNVTYGFNSMNRDKRHLVHEYSDYFGVRSESFDEEPNRNVVIFASKEKSYLPTVSLIDFVFRPLSTLRSERLKPHEDVTIRPEKRAQIQGPSNIWSNRAKLPSASTTLSSSQDVVVTTSQMVRLNIPRAAGGGPSTNSFSSAAAAAAAPSCSDFPAL